MRFLFRHCRAWPFVERRRFTRLCRQSILPSGMKTFWAIQREENIKHWSRKWKSDLVTSMNPKWRDLGRRMCADGRLSRRYSARTYRVKPGGDEEDDLTYSLMPLFPAA